MALYKEQKKVAYKHDASEKRESVCVEIYTNSNGKKHTHNCINGMKGQEHKSVKWSIVFV